MCAGTSCETHAAHLQVVADPAFKPGNWWVSLPRAYYQFGAQSAGLPSACIKLKASGRRHATETIVMRRSAQGCCGSSSAPWTFRCPCLRPPARRMSSFAMSLLRLCASRTPWHSTAASGSGASWLWACAVVHTMVQPAAVEQLNSIPQDAIETELFFLAGSGSCSWCSRGIHTSTPCNALTSETGLTR